MKITVVLLLEIAPVSLRGRLRHQAGLQADVRIAHFAFDFGRGIRAATESMTTTSTALERTSNSQISRALLAGVGLGDEQVVEGGRRALGPRGVQRVLGVDERGDAAHALGARR